MRIYLFLLSLFCCLTLFQGQNNVIASDTNTELEVIATECFLYKEASFDSEKILENEKPVTLILGDKLSLVQNGEKFYLVQTKNRTIGYIYKYYVCEKNEFYVYPTFNATIRTDNAIIYDVNKKPTTHTAYSGQKVYLYEGYNSNDFTAVQIVLEDGSLYNGYMLTKDIEPSGISSTLIIGISIIAAVVTIVLSLVFIKKKKKPYGSKV